jgi:hypothetical protein
MLAVIGGLGLLGKIASPSTFRGPVFLGLGPLMYLLAFADGLAFTWWLRRAESKQKADA